MVKKICVLRANALGDFIFIIPALKAIKETYPKAQLILLGTPWHKYFLEEHKGIVDRVIVVPVSQGVRKDPKIKENKKELEKFFKQMKKERFDIAVQLHGGGEYSNVFMSKLGANLTVGLKTKNASALDINLPYIYYQKEVNRYLEVVSLIGARTSKIEPEIRVTQKDLKEAAEVLQKVKKPFVVIHPGASEITRRWPAFKFGQIADFVVNLGFDVVVTGSKQEKEIINEVLKNVKSKIFNICGKTTLGGLAGVLFRSSLVIANDTGPLHLAESVGAKTVGLYWCGNLINSAPQTRQKHRPVISWVIDCPRCGQNCSKIFPFGPLSPTCNHKFSFLGGITIADVKEAVCDLLT